MRCLRCTLIVPDTTRAAARPGVGSLSGEMLKREQDDGNRVQENTQKMKSDYATVAGHLRPLALKMQTIFMPIMIWDSLALMLLGVALYKWGFLSGRWSNRD